ncbi:hypothetical protein JR316_0006191 [Psilocybe cubensis]|uniref:Uncharacterized protein n=1 Tax=Psilocybe cubensis TaxID=181762 RepID=A0ACB8H1T8_PSICU|nr:hypothetical protein JR316_0006191 [Psilocybe cubensis]KAH9481664.1 hypothetical protein JR316_0006191 [Psilocybe cubensis]
MANVTEIGNRVASAAILPSGERIAVLNLNNEVDFYSTSYRKHISTTPINVPGPVPHQRKFIADITFIDDETVAFGHSNGYVGFITYGMTDSVKTFTIDGDGPKGEVFRCPIQTIAYGLIGHQPHILAVIPSSLAASGVRPHYHADVHIGRISNSPVTSTRDSSEFDSVVSLHF